MNDLHQMFAAMDGAVIAGGCDTCDSEQRPWIDVCGVLRINVAHDDWCPTWRRIRAERKRKAKGNP